MLGRGALINGVVVWLVGNHASPFFLHPKSMVSLGHIIILEGLNVRFFNSNKILEYLEGYVLKVCRFVQKVQSY